MKNLIITIALAMIILVVAPQSFAKDQQALKNRLAYLNDISEVSWVRYDRNNVYVGFNKKPRDLASIVGGAAFFGNQAYSFGVHVWAIPANNPNWKVGDPYYCEATGRGGRVKDNDCR